MSETNEGIVDSSFVAPEFYIEPPSSTATPDEWNAWLKAEKNKATAAKAAHTRSLKHADLPEVYQDGAIMLRGPDGTWRQSVAVGFSGDFSSGQGNMEVLAPATQEREFVMKAMKIGRHKPSCKSKAKSRRRRKNRKRRKALGE